MSATLVLALSVVSGATEAFARELPLERSSFRIHGAFFHQFRTNRDAFVRLPPYLAVRRPDDPDLRYLWDLQDDKATDSPMAHGASFVEFAFEDSVSRDLSIQASLTADLRGYSFGVFNRDNVAVYPKYFASYLWESDNDAARAYKYPIGLAAQAGTFQDDRHYEGLQLYNLDYQAIYVHAQVGRVRFSHLHIGDMRSGIGLGVDDWVDYRVSLEDWAVWDDWTADLRLGATDYDDFTSDSWLDVGNLSLGLERDRTRLYGQIGFRPIPGGFDWRLKYASLLGAYSEGDHGWMDHETRMEWRHYGGVFNYERSQQDVYYRERYDDDGFGNFNGPQLYPLEAIDRPFSQWAVFTEYDKRYVDGLTLHTDLEFDIQRSHTFRVELDLNTIFAEGEDVFLYWFYSAGPVVRAAEDAYLSLSLTNKTMNLDKHYPTFYQLTRPVVQFEIRREFD